MEYLAPSKCRNLDVTDAFSVAGTDVLAALNALQSNDLATAAVFSTKQDALPNISNVASINQNLSTASNVQFNRVNLGTNGFITWDDGQAQLLISGGITNASRYVVIRPYSPGSGGSALQCTAGSFQITKVDGSGISLYINNNTGDVSVDGLSVTRPTILGAMNTNAGCATRKDYVDGLVATAGTGLTKTGNVFLVNGAQTLSSLTMTGPLISSSALAAPTFTARSVGTKAVFFSNTSASTVDFAIGTETDNLWFSTASALTGFKWYAGTTSVANMDGGGNLSVNGFISCNRVAVANLTPSSSSHLASKSYVDGISYLTTGTGLTKTAGALSVNAAQTQITSVGTLTSLGVSGDVSTDGNLIVNGTTDSTALGNGAAVLLGGMSVAKKIRTGGGLVVNAGGVYVNAGGVNVTGVSSFTNSLSCYALSATAGGINVTGVSTFTNSVTVFGLTCQNALTLQTEPTSATHATTKGYVDGAIATSSTANPNKISTGVMTNGSFSIDGLTFNGLSRELRYSKVGSTVTVSFKASWTSATGTLAESNTNCLVDAPFSSLDSRIVMVGIQKDSFFVSRAGFMDENILLQVRVNAADVPGYSGPTTLMLSWTFWTTP